jgi:hypothetical protein
MKWFTLIISIQPAREPVVVPLPIGENVLKEKPCRRGYEWSDNLLYIPLAVIPECFYRGSRRFAGFSLDSRSSLPQHDSSRGGNDVPNRMFVQSILSPLRMMRSQELGINHCGTEGTEKNLFNSICFSLCLSVSVVDFIIRTNSSIISLHVFGGTLYNIHNIRISSPRAENPSSAAPGYRNKAARRGSPRSCRTSCR